MLMEECVSASGERAVVDDEVQRRGVVAGYNHDIPHRGRLYHVQTEDSGRSKGRVFTHVFLAGSIIASNRVDYDRTMQVSDITELAKASHALMLRRLVRGELDEESERQRPTEPAQALPVDTVPEPPAAVEDPSDMLDMANVTKTLENLRINLPGTFGIALVDCESGMCLGMSGGGLDMDVAAAGNMEVIKVKARVVRDLGIEGGIEDILITLESQCHIIRPVGATLFLYLAIDRKQGNLALARHRLAAAAAEIEPRRGTTSV